jgi:hypothetical protein
VPQLATWSPDEGTMKTLKRMQWWAPAGERLPPTSRFLLFDLDAGGLNNIRMGWEMVAMVAQFTGRTLVLPPAKPWYLLDFGPRPEDLVPKSMAAGGQTNTVMGDLLNLKQMLANVPTLLPEEFEQLRGESWETAASMATFVKREHPHDCLEGPAYRKVDATYLMMGERRPKGSEKERREGFFCADWAVYGGPKASIKSEAGMEGYSMLMHGFVWHEDAFNIASVVVNYFGIFGYRAVHARYNDFKIQHPTLIKAADEVKNLLLPWLNLEGPRTLYIATDDAALFEGLKMPGLRIVMWRDLFVGSTGAVLNGIKASFSPERWYKLIAIVEMLICTYAESFVGTHLSTYSGHIMVMRMHARAPVTRRMVVTSELPIDDVKADLQKWRENPILDGPRPRNEGDEFRL